MREFMLALSNRTGHVSACPGSSDDLIETGDSPQRLGRTAVSVWGKMIGPSGEQLFGPFDAGRNEGAGDIPCLFQQLADSFKAGGDVGSDDVERSLGGIEGTLVCMTNVGRGEHEPAFGNVGGRLIGLSGYATSRDGPTSRRLRGLRALGAPPFDSRQPPWMVIGGRRRPNAGNAAFTELASPRTPRRALHPREGAPSVSRTA